MMQNVENKCRQTDEDVLFCVLLSDRSGGRFKNTYELLNLRALKI